MWIGRMWRFGRPWVASGMSPTGIFLTARSAGTNTRRKAQPRTHREPLDVWTSIDVHGRLAFGAYRAGPKRGTNDRPAKSFINWDRKRGSAGPGRLAVPPGLVRGPCILPRSSRGNAEARRRRQGNVSRLWPAGGFVRPAVRQKRLRAASRPSGHAYLSLGDQLARRRR